LGEEEYEGRGRWGEEGGEREEGSGDVIPGVLKKTTVFTGFTMRIPGYLRYSL
jgi:hypothetical protein